MKGTIRILRPQPVFRLLISLGLFLSVVQHAAAQPTVATDPDAIQRRIARARALAAAGNLPAARSELESLRNSVQDESVREIALVLLMGIYFEQADFIYAENLLNEAFRARAPGNDAAARAYYLLAGQVINGVRAQIDRYRGFGLDVSDRALPDEAVAHLDRLRKLLEHVVGQGRQLRDENARSIDAAALLESTTSARVLVARNEAERAQWQREVADVRQRLAGSTQRQAANATPGAQPAVGVTQAVPEPTPAPPRPSATPAPSPTNTTPSGPGPQTGQPPAPAAPLEVGSLIPRAAQTVAPTYPPAARSARVTGRVTVFLLIDEKGAVAAIKRTDGPELLRRAAEDAARRWKFRPTVVNGQAARVTGFISFNFEL